MAMYLGGPTPGPGSGGGPIVRGPFTSGNGGRPLPPANGGFNSASPIVRGPFSTGGSGAAPSNPNVLGPQSIRPTGDNPGFDPSYLQNLSTAIGGLFSRPQGNLSFNPLGNLSEISNTTGGGNAPLPGLPSTLLQDAIQGLAFMFNPPVQPKPSSGPTVGGNGGERGRNRIPFLQ